MRSTPVTVAAAQYSPIYMDLAASTKKACGLIKEAAAKGAELVVFPETFLPSYTYWTLVLDSYSVRQSYGVRLYEQALVVGDESTVALSEAARQAQCTVVMGVTEREGGTLYNSQLVIDASGEVLGCRRKLVATYHERMSYGGGGGPDLRVFDTAIGKVGALVCYEHSNPLFRYAVQAQGEEIHVANWPGGLPWTDPIIDAATRQYAFEAQCFVLSVTSCLTQDFIDQLGDKAREILKPGGGCSTIIAPGGKVLARAGDGEEMLYAQLDPRAIAEWKHIVDSMGHYARPDVVQLHLNPHRPSPLVVEG
jgi:aliphatic nitrilase